MPSNGLLFMYIHTIYRGNTLYMTLTLCSLFITNGLTFVNPTKTSLELIFSWLIFYSSRVLRVVKVYACQVTMAKPNQVFPAPV
jgi:hypothetical protein